jgi:hydroxyacylglutathione hydrolase
MSHEEIAWSGFAAPGLVGIDETPLTIGAMTIRPMLTPGHTPGCVCYRIDDNLFTGDVLFAEGCGICPDLDGAYRMYESLQRLRANVDDTTRIYPGHSFGLPPGQSFATILRENIYLQFNKKEDFAGFRLRKGQSRAKLFTFH